MGKSGREKFEKNEKIIDFFIFVFKIFPKPLRFFIWDMISSHSQVLFIALRYVILKTLISECGKNVRIGTNVQIINWNNIKLGNNVSIHANCYLDGAGGIEIGNEVSVAHNTSILSSNHSWLDSNLPIKYNPVILNKVIINDDVWIGCGCRILSGVSIESRSIIAAGAVVTKSCLVNGIYGGVPAKYIKSL